MAFFSQFYVKKTEYFVQYLVLVFIDSLWLGIYYRLFCFML